MSIRIFIESFKLSFDIFSGIFKNEKPPWPLEGSPTPLIMSMPPLELMVTKFYDRFQGVHRTSFSMNLAIICFSGSRCSDEYLFEA